MTTRSTPGGLDRVGAHPGPDRDPGLVLLVALGVAEVGDDGGDRCGAGPLEGVDPEQQLHEVVVGREGRPLHQEDVPAPDVLEHPDEQVAFREPQRLARTERQSRYSAMARPAFDWLIRRGGRSRPATSPSYLHRGALPISRWTSCNVPLGDEVGSAADAGVLELVDLGSVRDQPDHLLDGRPGEFDVPLGRVISRTNTAWSSTTNVGTPNMWWLSDLPLVGLADFVVGPGLLELGETPSTSTPTDASASRTTASSRMSRLSS